MGRDKIQKNISDNFPDDWVFTSNCWQSSACVLASVLQNHFVSNSNEKINLAHNPISDCETVYSPWQANLKYKSLGQASTIIHFKHWFNLNYLEIQPQTSLNWFHELSKFEIIQFTLSRNSVLYCGECVCSSYKTSLDYSNSITHNIKFSIYSRS